LSLLEKKKILHVKNETEWRFLFYLKQVRRRFDVMNGDKTGGALLIVLYDAFSITEPWQMETTKRFT
jgi:hypothetical protein